MKTRGWRADPYRLIVTLAFLVFGLPGFTAMASAADATRGGQLYAGSLAMAKGGAPCIACHALTGVDIAAATTIVLGAILATSHVNTRVAATSKEQQITRDVWGLLEGMLKIA